MEQQPWVNTANRQQPTHLQTTRLTCTAAFLTRDLLLYPTPLVQWIFEEGADPTRTRGFGARKQADAHACIFRLGSGHTLVRRAGFSVVAAGRWGCSRGVPPVAGEPGRRLQLSQKRPRHRQGAVGGRPTRGGVVPACGQCADLSRAVGATVQRHCCRAARSARGVRALQAGAASAPARLCAEIRITSGAFGDPYLSSPLATIVLLLPPLSCTYSSCPPAFVPPCRPALPPQAPPPPPWLAPFVSRARDHGRPPEFSCAQQQSPSAMPSPHHAHMPQGDLASPHPLSLPPTPSPDDFTDLSDVSAFASSELDEYDFLLHDSLSSAPASEPFSPLRLPASPVSPAASAPASASVFAASSSESLLLSGVDLDSLKSRRTPNERFPDAGQAAEAVTSQTNTNPAELASTPDPTSKDTSPPSAAAHAHNVSDTRELSRSCDMHDSTMTDVLFFPQHRAGFFSPTSSTLELEESWCHASAMHTPQHPFSSTYPTDSVRLTRPWNLRRSVLDEPAPDSSHDVTSISASTIAPESVAHQDSRNVHPLSVRALAHIFTSDRNVRNTLQPAISEIQASLTKAYPSSKVRPMRPSPYICDLFQDSCYAKTSSLL